MKRILIASAVAFAAGGQALAADLPPPMAPPPRAPAMYVPVVPLYNWTGFYLGGNLGFGLTGGSFNSPSGHVCFDNHHTSFLGGGQVGVNYEFGGGVVIGAEAMFDWLPNTKNTVNLKRRCSGANLGSATINNRWLTTATGKLGYAWDRVLLYAKGGGAWVGTNTTNRHVRRRAGWLFRSYQQFGLDCGCRRRMGVRGQLVGAGRVRLYRPDQPDLDLRLGADCHVASAQAAATSNSLPPA